jgi:DNA transposition AAA+ family ATPase
VTARHFLDLADAATVETAELALTRRAITDIARHRALGVVHGAAGLGKTFAVERALTHLDQGWAPIWLSFPVRPTMRLIAIELLHAISGQHAQGDRFRLTRVLKSELALTPRIVICDEAQNLNRECIEFLRHLAEDPRRQGATLLVGGDGCWDVLSRDAMLRSRVLRRVCFTPLSTAEIVSAIRGYHPVYHGVDEELIRFVDLHCGHGNFRNWASFTLTAVDLCAEAGRPRVDEQIARNAFALLGGGVGVA